MLVQSTHQDATRSYQTTPLSGTSLSIIDSDAGPSDDLGVVLPLSLDNMPEQMTFKQFKSPIDAGSTFQYGEKIGVINRSSDHYPWWDTAFPEPLVLEEHTMLGAAFNGTTRVPFGAINNYPHQTDPELMHVAKDVWGIIVPFDTSDDDGGGMPWYDSGAQPVNGPLNFHMVYVYPSTCGVGDGLSSCYPLAEFEVYPQYMFGEHYVSADGRSFSMQNADSSSSFDTLFHATESSEEPLFTIPAAATVFVEMRTYALDYTPYQQDGSVWSTYYSSIKANSGDLWYAMLIFLYGGNIEMPAIVDYFGPDSNAAQLNRPPAIILDTSSTFNMDVP